MIKKLLLVVISSIFMVHHISAQNGDWDWFLDKCPTYLYYEMPFKPVYTGEVVRYDNVEEVVNGKTYNVIRIALFGRVETALTPPLKDTFLHMRRNGKQLLIRYDEYKAVMEERGYDMATFDEQCRYEVTDDGDMVLYDFGMQVGDKFRSVPGKEDVYVVSIKKEQHSYHVPQQENINVIVLSNGCEIVEDIGFKQYVVGSQSGVINPGFDFLDYLNPSDEYGAVLWLARLNHQWVWEDCLDDGSTGIDRPSSNTTNQTTFDLQGRRLDGQPINRGIYIQNGKKIVVK